MTNVNRNHRGPPEWMPPARFIIFCVACLAIPLALAHFWTAASVAANAPVSSALAPVSTPPTSSPTTAPPLNFNVGPGSATTPTTVAPAAVTPTPAAPTPAPVTPAPTTTPLPTGPTSVTVPVTTPICTLTYQSSPDAQHATFALASNQPNQTAYYRWESGATYSTAHNGTVQTDSAGAATITVGPENNAPIGVSVSWPGSAPSTDVCQASYTPPGT